MLSPKGLLFSPLMVLIFNQWHLLLCKSLAEIGDRFHLKFKEKRPESLNNKKLLSSFMFYELRFTITG